MTEPTSAPKYPQKKVEVTAFHSNIKQEIIEITTDKLRLILNDHLKKSEKKIEWHAALGIFLTAIASLFTTTFNTTFGVQGDVWRSIFILGAVSSFVWLIICGIKAFRTPTVDQLIERIKRGV